MLRTAIKMRCCICKKEFVGIPSIPETTGDELIEIVVSERDEAEDFICEKCQEERINN